MATKAAKYTLGLDFGTNSVRALVVDVGNGNEVGTAIFDYPSGKAGILLDPKDANLARQNPADWILGIEKAVPDALAASRKKVKGFDPAAIVGIGVDTTGSTPLPVDRAGKPLALYKEFKKNLNAQAWLWKDHTGHAEAAEITALAAAEHPEYLAKCGGTYSSEWFWSKILHALRIDPKVAAAAFSWVECADYIPGVLTGDTDPIRMKRSRCAAGHKAMFNDKWGGLPAKAFLAKLDPRLGELRDRLYSRTFTSDVPAGGLTKEWAKKLGLRPGIAVAASSRSSAPARATFASGRLPRSSPTSPACAASSTAPSCQAISVSRPDSPPSATSSIGSSTSSSRAGRRRAPMPH
jgi:L-ribulokinase